MCASTSLRSVLLRLQFASPESPRYEWNGQKNFASANIAGVFLTDKSIVERAEEGSRESCDSQCRKLTASWVREAHVTNPDIETCAFYEGLEAAGAEGVMEPGV